MSNTRSARLAPLVALVATVTAGPAAYAGNYHVHVRGGVTIAPGAGVRVHPPVYVAPPRVYRPPHFWVHGPIFGYRPTYYYAYPYPYERAYVAYAAPAPAPYYAPEGAVAVARDREPTIGLGIRGSTLRAGDNHPSAEGLGALLRFRARPVELELEVGWDNYGQDTQRSDTRVATSLYVPIVGRELQPYLVVGAGMNFANFGTTGDVLHQGFMDGGGGLMLNFGRQFAISGDVRYVVRHFFDNADVVARQPLALTTVPGPTPSSNDLSTRDAAVEFRANAVIYF